MKTIRDIRDIIVNDTLVLPEYEADYDRIEDGHSVEASVIRCLRDEPEGDDISFLIDAALFGHALALAFMQHYLSPPSSKSVH